MSNDLSQLMAPEELADLKANAAAAEADFGLRSGFLIDLLSEADDWSFIIKAHAFLESAVNRLICHHLAKPDISDSLSRIGIRRLTELAEAMGLLPKDEVRMIGHLGQLRNALVHKPSNTGFALSEYLADSNARIRFGESFSVAWSTTADVKSDADAQEFAVSEPRLGILMSVLLVAVRCAAAKSEKDLEK